MEHGARVGIGVWAFAVCLAVTPACGDDGDDGAGGSGTGTGSAGGFLGSCDTRVTGEAAVLGQCREWSGSPGADLSVSCGGLGGTFSPTAHCPSDSLVGSCVLEPVLDTVATYHYYAPDWTAADGQSHCDGLGGTFTST